VMFFGVGCSSRIDRARSVRALDLVAGRRTYFTVKRMSERGWPSGSFSLMHPFIVRLNDPLNESRIGTNGQTLMLSVEAVRSRRLTKGGFYNFNRIRRTTSYTLVGSVALFASWGIQSHLLSNPPAC
jgi:hypothetical protein